ncbi:unnamed protein product [Spirodela intermedia]|uniref:Uncharacterized protein n=2 Tax=Spirodela intermedia TaxID=51605 RepID=A0A7I8I975_SPIIN|nr:unnamed protein product [Spirodela intermedia]CAA6654227.1 unnamed protein product [Spirodela intermedia]CAA7388616.1 unnamed protein product [Spirodela intermedia]
MKSRQPPHGGAATAAAQRTRNRQRLGGRGVGLSLMSFANAKSTDTGYNPAIIKKQREFYKNAKIVKKYKKTVKQRNQQEEKHLPDELVHENTPADAKNEKKKKKRRKEVRLQSLREEYEKRQEEKERERKEREAAIQARKEERARAKAGRKALREKMFKRTSSGQPVMRYRIEHVLQNILQSPPN